MNIALCRSVLLITVLGSILPGSAQPITTQCADTLLGLSRQWADAYMAQHPEIKIHLVGASAAATLAALADQKIQIALVPRAIRYKEAQVCEAAFGQRPAEYKVGVVGAVVYVHAANPAMPLTYDELVGIFRGKLRNWKEVGGKDAPIVVFGVETNTAAGELFAEEVLNGKGLARDVRVVALAELLKVIGRETNSIGFGPFVSAPEGARALNIKRVVSSTPAEPSEEAISNRVYPISRFLYCYLSPAPTQGPTKAYVDWIRSDQGQQIARQAGFFLLPPKFRPAQ